MSGTLHLYVHLPFCAHRCGYCDFVTVTGHEAVHAEYVDALLAELGRHDIAPETIYIGGGTPSLLDDRLGDFTGDERKVKQVLVNLLSNAVKFTPSGGRVTLDGAADNWFGPWPPPGLTDGSGEVPVEERR